MEKEIEELRALLEESHSLLRCIAEYSTHACDVQDLKDKIAKKLAVDGSGQ